MKIFRFPFLFIILFTILLLSSFSSAEDINLSDENVAKSLLLGKAFYCWMKEANYNGPIKIATTSIKGNKFKGMSKEWCYQDLNWTGKFKKNQMSIIQQGTSAQTCYCRNGSLTFTKNNDGDLIAEGIYKVGCGSTPFKGELQCVVK